MNKLRMKTIGAIGYAVSQHNGQQQMFVMVIDATAPGTAANGVPHLSHLATLKFDAKYLSKDHKQPFYLISANSKESRQYGHMVLRGDDLEIRVGGKPIPATGLNIVTEGKHNFYLNPMMEKIYPGGLAVKDECLMPNSRPAAVGLAARMCLSTGSIGAFPGDNNEFVAPQEMTFTGVNNGYRQKFVACNLHEVEFDGNEVEIYSKRLGRGIFFQPDQNGVVEISLENMPPAGLESLLPYSPEQGVDFELIYQIAKERPAQLRVPMRASIGPEYPVPLLCYAAIYNPQFNF